MGGSEWTAGECVGVVVSGAFFFNVLVSILMAAPGDDGGQTPFLQALVESGVYIWGIVLLCIGTCVVFLVVSELTDYVYGGGLQRDIRGWQNRE